MKTAANTLTARKIDLRLGQGSHQANNTRAFFQAK
jgi:hypothetical protein